ncbi:restriction endonuclease subunit S [Lactiplantibacillus plantarum]|uniref:restriction endonuclease subunit S n=1 Tax=Lactiplantibacillus plantarum TaxID=1590 RepID=UPI002872CE54|nr:restriction endonuclease subunit S [Lactiplantibacillus plantarum]WNC18958.1 restriction endonuclease subunit S [Lactiplantibacillus plantarum]
MKDNQAKYPQLRFKGFTDPWEERKLGEFSDVRDGTHASPKYVSQGHPMVTSKNLTHSGLDMTDVSFLTDKDFNEINKRSKVSIGDILFGMIGTIGNPVIVDRDDFAIKNVALIKEKTSNPITNKWLLQYLKSPSFNRFIQKENAGGTQKFIALGLIRDMKLRVPEFDEQQKIGAFFKKIDDTIALHQRKLAKLKELKQGYLQKMFPQNGSKFPQLRFAGFADDWEQVRFGDLYDKINEKNDLSFGSDQIISVANMYYKESSNVNSSDDYMKTYNIFRKGDIAFEGHKSKHYSYGRFVENDIGDGIVSHVFDVFRPKTDYDLYFWKYLINNENVMGHVLRRVTTKATMMNNLVAKDFLKASIHVPTTEEQTKIGNFLATLDSQITIHQRKLDLLKEQKKGFLQKMFI